MVINRANGYNAEHNNSSRRRRKIKEKRMLLNVLTLAGGSVDEEFDLF